MPKERYYFSCQLLQSHSVAIEDNELHHLLHVMRTKVGNEIEIVNGKGQLGKGVVAAIEKKKALIDITEVYTTPTPNYRLVLAQAIPRVNRLECILEKATELGVTDICLFASSLSEKKCFTEHQIERLKSITIAAMKQCGRLHLPSLKFSATVEDVDFTEVAFFGDITIGKLPALSSLYEHSMKEVTIFIGPESGFTLSEEEFLRKRQVKGVTLHPNILRTDTAAIASLSILSHLMLNDTFIN